MFQSLQSFLSSALQCTSFPFLSVSRETASRDTLFLGKDSLYLVLSPHGVWGRNQSRKLPLYRYSTKECVSSVLLRSGWHLPCVQVVEHGLRRSVDFHLTEAIKALLYVHTLPADSSLSQIWKENLASQRSFVLGECINYGVIILTKLVFMFFNIIIFLHQLDFPIAVFKWEKPYFLWYFSSGLRKISVPLISSMISLVIFIIYDHCFIFVCVCGMQLQTQDRVDLDFVTLMSVHSPQIFISLLVFCCLKCCIS